jgi:hypothetical protein
MQNTLFDEGMRIAQQFGLSDFAEELKGLADTSPEEETKDITDSLKRNANSMNDGENGDLSTEETHKKLRLDVNGQEIKEEEGDS